MDPERPPILDYRQRGDEPPPSWLSALVAVVVGMAGLFLLSMVVIAVSAVLSWIFGIR